MKVLVADDERIIRKAIIHVINWAALGITHVMEARNGREALVEYDRHHPEIIITDIRIPGRRAADRGPGGECPVSQLSLPAGERPLPPGFLRPGGELFPGACKYALLSAGAPAQAGNRGGAPVYRGAPSTPISPTSGCCTQPGCSPPAGTGCMSWQGAWATRT